VLARSASVTTDSSWPRAEQQRPWADSSMAVTPVSTRTGNRLSPCIMDDSSFSLHHGTANGRPVAVQVLRRRPSAAPRRRQFTPLRGRPMTTPPVAQPLMRDVTLWLDWQHHMHCLWVGEHLPGQRRWHCSHCVAGLQGRARLQGPRRWRNHAYEADRGHVAARHHR